MLFWGYFGALAYGVFCLLISLFAYKLGVPKRYTRKIVHILVGFEWMILYHLMGVGIHFLAVCLIFTAMLAIAYKKNLMAMISSDSDNAPGTVYYGVSMTVMAIVSIFIEGFVFAFGIAVLCTSIGDGFAGVIGSSVKKFNPAVYKNKTLIGSVSMAFFSFVSTLIFSDVYKLNLGFFECLMIGILAAGMELITDFGLDNVTIPISASAFAYFLMNFSGAENYIVPIVLTPFIIAVALSRGILTRRGVIFAVVLDLVISIALGNFGFVLLLAFLILSVGIDKIKAHFNKKDEITAKTGARDSVQVFANGIVPMFAALLYLLTGNFVFVIAFSAAIAEAFADTAASGVGMLSSSAFDIVRMRKVPVGLSGGVSLIGTLASLVAPAVILLIPMAFGVFGFATFVICSLCAFLGAFIDSVLGSALQAKYKCSVCSKVTEKKTHCGALCEKTHGVSFISNDVVNLVSCVFASILAILIV